MGRPRSFLAFAAVALLVAPAFGQGPASCGFHLDIRCDGTGTHSAVADIPSGPGSGGFPMPPATPGNPYTAWATPGSPMAMIISGNPLAYGPAPLGPGACATVFYSIGPPAQVPLALPVATFVQPCLGPGTPAIAGILPITGAIIDSCGFLGPPPPFGLFDAPPGTGRWTLSGAYPPFAPPVSFQAAGVTPGGLIWVSNPVTVFPGASPFEVPVPLPVACGAIPPLDEGQSLGNPTPPGFTFYGFPQPFVDVNTNGYVDFAAGVGAGVFQGCDFTGTSGDLGCAPPTAGFSSPRVEVNHADFDFAVPLAPPFFPIITMEVRPPGPTWPDAIIYRWKNAPVFGTPPGTAGLLTSAFALELQGGACPCPPPFAPNRIVAVRSWLTVADQCGIGPGPGIPAFAPYPAPPAGAPTCGLGAAGLAFMGTFGPPLGLPFPGVPAGVIHMDAAAASVAVGNSAILFTPTPGIPAAYMLTVY